MGNKLQAGVLVQGKYRLESLLGEGGFGAVWKATQLNVERPVAIKFLKAMIADENALRRFERESKALARLQHPNCVTMIDHGSGESGSFLVTEYLDGEQLDHWAEGDHDVATILLVARQVLAALDHAHQQRIVHRDLKPANILIGTDPDGAILTKVLDFGIASVVGAKRGDITKTGEVFGTPGYMSPEQLLGESNVGPPADLYAFGAVLYQMIEQRKLFNASSGIEVAMKHLTHDPPKLQRPVPPGLQDVLDRLLQKKSEDRFQSAEEVIRALNRVGTAPMLQQLPAFGPGPAAPPAQAVNTPPPAIGRQSVATPTPRPPGGASPSREYTPTPGHGALPGSYDDRVSPGWTPGSTERGPIVVEDRSNLTMFLVVVLALVVLAGVVAWQLWPQDRDSDPSAKATRQVPGLLRGSEKAPPPVVDEAAKPEPEEQVPANDAGLAPDDSPLPVRSVGCGLRAPRRGLTQVSQLSGFERETALVYVPRNYDPGVPHRTLLAFHDTLQTPDELITELQLAAAADRDNVVIVLPDLSTMFNSPWKHPDEWATAKRNLEVAQSQLCLRPRDVMILGFGSGGHAAQKLACMLPSVGAIVISTYRKLKDDDDLCHHGDVPHLFLAPLEDGRDPVDGGAGCLGGDAIVTLDLHEQIYREMYDCSGRAKVESRYGGSVCKTWDCAAPYISCRVDGGRPLPRQETVPRISVTRPGCTGKAANFPYGEKIWSFLMASTPPTEAPEATRDAE